MFASSCGEPLTSSWSFCQTQQGTKFLVKEHNSLVSVNEQFNLRRVKYSMGQRRRASLVVELNGRGCRSFSIPCKNNFKMAQALPYQEHQVKGDFQTLVPWSSRVAWWRKSLQSGHWCCVASLGFLELGSLLYPWAIINWFWAYRLGGWFSEPSTKLS